MKAAAFLSLIMLVAGGATVARGQSGLTGFDPNANLPVLTVVVQPDGKILLGGSFTTLSPNGGAAVMRNRIARVNPDGTLDTSFNPNANLDVETIAVQADGKILVGGFFTNMGGQTWNRIARLNPNGTLDSTFNPNANGAVRSIAMQADGKILVGGDFTTLAPNGGVAVTTGHLARINSNGTLDAGFNPNANDRVNAIVVQADGKILVGGRFNQGISTPTIGGATRNRIARLDATTGAADSFNPNASSLVVAVAMQADGKILVGGDFNGANSIGGATRNRIARLDATTGVADSLFNPNANNAVFTIAVQADGKILAGGDFNGANSIGGATRNNVARLDPLTGAADSFDPSASAQASVYAIALEGDKVLAGGNFSSIGGQARNYIARLETDGVIPYFVNTTADTVVAGACGHAAAGCSLRGAIQAVNAAGTGTIVFAMPASDPNCANGVCTINLTQALPDLAAPMSIEGPGAEKLTVRRDTGGNYGIFTVATTGTVSFFGLTISNGATQSSSGGGGVLNGNATVQIVSCILANNRALAGIGAAGLGGGISNNIGIMNISDTVITGNRSDSLGGGICNRQGTVNLFRSVISDNQAGGAGGGISNAFDFNAEPTLNVTNTTISGNTSSSSGAGISGGGKTSVTNSTITINISSAGSGGGITSPAGTTNIKSSIVALNSAPSGPDASGNFISAGFNLIGKRDESAGFTATTDQTGTAASPLDPKLDPNGLQNNGGPTKTIALLFGSPAIDKGTSVGLTGNLTTDQRGSGFQRTFNDPNVAKASGGDETDIGAFELQSAPPTPTPTPTPGTTPTVTPGATPTPTPTPNTTPASLANISTRLHVGTGNNVLFAGFIIQGSGSKTVLIRSIGPSLTGFGVLGAMSNPKLELHDQNNLIGVNDNWQTTQLGGIITSDQVASIENSGVKPNDAAEPAIIATLPAGSYTAIVAGAGDTQGVATVELYDLSPNNGATLVNISTRGFIQTGDNVMIGGFIIGGQSLKVIVIAAGPSLIPFGINNALTNPQLELHDANGALAGNDNWQTTQLGGIITADQSDAIQNSGLAPGSPAESAIIATLAPGNYTAIAQGVNSEMGVGVIQIYALP